MKEDFALAIKNVTTHNPCTQCLYHGNNSCTNDDVTKSIVVHPVYMLDSHLFIQGLCM